MSKLIYPKLYKSNLSVEDTDNKTVSVTTRIKIGMNKNINFFKEESKKDNEKF